MNGEKGAEYRLDQLQVDFTHPLGEGGAAEVFRCTTPAGNRRIFKQYNADSLERLDADALRHLIEWPTTHLDADDRTHLQTICAWPEAIVTTNNKVVGILMPEAPAKFFTTRKEHPEPRHFSRVAVKRHRAAKGGYPYYDFPQKIARLGSLLSALQFLHSAKVVIGDLQWNNILTTGTEPYNGATSADVYFVDCDSFIIDGRAPLTNMDPMSWKPPYKTSGFSAITDMYKFALTVIRCLSEQTNQDTVDYSLYKHLLPSSDFAKLHSLLTSPDPGLTSGDLGALARAWQASVSRDGRMHRRTDSAAREPWTAAMRKAHLAGLPASTSSPHNTSASASTARRKPGSRRTSVSARKSTDASAQTAPWRPEPCAGPPDAPTGSARKGWLILAVAAVVVLIVSVLSAVITSDNQNRSSSTTTSTLGTTPTSMVTPLLSSASSGYPSRSVTTPPSSIPPSPSSRTSPQQANLPGTDAHGFVDYSAARCDPGSTPAVMERTTQSVLVVCEIGPANYYYRGVRLSDSASIELANVVRSSDGFDVTNPVDGTRYQIRPTGISITSPGGEVSSEPMIQYAAS